MQIVEKEMTLDDFLELLRQTPRCWDVMPGGMLRQQDRGFWTACPITSLMTKDELRPAIFVEQAAKELGLSKDLMFEIIEAADGWQFSTLRGLLMEACGIK